MNQIYLTVLLTLVGYISSYAQMHVSVGTFYGAYQMDDLKEFLNSNSTGNQHPDIKIASSFPHFCGTEAKLYFVFNRLSVGAQASLSSTGGNANFEDANTLLKYDIRIKHKVIGIGAEYVFNKNLQSPFHYLISVQAGYGYSLLNTEGKVKSSQFSPVVITNGKFKSDHFNIQPGIGVRWQYKYLFTTLLGSYFFDFQDSALERYDENGPQLYRRVEADWSGVRLSLSIGIKINEKKNL
ncbi:MAG: hypothetical protein O9340_11890 [Cyclobacteriaceae bacterium]|jgi:hypothetical protein|nr:hypothetical protein [Cyclobacteriaceae bacterium]